MTTTSKTKVSSTDLTSDRKLFSIENAVEKANPLNSIIAEAGDFLVEGVCEKKGVLRKKKKKKISRLNPLYLATI